MPLTTLESDTVTRSCAVARILLDQVKPQLDALNIIYDAVGGAKETITQGELDTVPSFSAITKVQLDDGLYALTNTLRVALTNSYTQLAQLAVRG